MESFDKNDPESRLALVLLRSARLWDQTELARAACIAPSQLSMYERGERATPREVLERAAEATGFPSYLLELMLWVIRSFRAVARGRAHPSRVHAAVYAAEMLALSQETADLLLEACERPSRRRKGAGPN